MQLFLMRHGEASHQASSDAQRPLTERGIADIQRCSHLLTELHVQFTAILASPRLRAQQTAQIIAEQQNLDVIINGALDFEFTHDKLRAILDHYADDAVVLCVGHNPSMTEVVQQVSGARVALPAGGLVCLEALSAHLRQVHLRWFITPEVIQVVRR